jgi:hypothetical protein
VYIYTHKIAVQQEKSHANKIFPLDISGKRATGLSALLKDLGVWRLSEKLRGRLEGGNGGLII